VRRLLHDEALNPAEETEPLFRRGGACRRCDVSAPVGARRRLADLNPIADTAHLNVGRSTSRRAEPPRAIGTAPDLAQPERIMTQMNPFILHATWTLTAAFVISCAYELYRATAKAGVSRHDSMAAFYREGLPVYIIAGLVISLMFWGWSWAAWLGLTLSLLGILISVFYYNPRIMIERKPELLDWGEDLVFTGLLFVAATQLMYGLF
jgi:hypothetical protein